jgi:D-alanine-D-alanine ligase
MAKKKIRVAVLFGGKSAEHEVSLQSARNVIEALDKEKYEVVPIGINKAGKWLLSNTSNYLLNTHDPTLIQLNKSNKEVGLVVQSAGTLADINSRESHGKIDVVFPVLHGPYGEDGSIQGLLKLAGVPFVGAGVLGSAIGMDKDVTKRLLKAANIPVAKFLVVQSHEKISYKEAKKALGMPVFIKPTNLGSSVGVSKAKDEKSFKKALNDAFQYDSKVMIEEAIIGREVECSVLGNEKPIASIPGEVIPRHEFYSYEAKYIDENGAALEIPAKLTKTEVKAVQQVAINAFKVLNCEGMARVDFFLKKNGQVLVNEINTIPGFTAISMYPKLWEASGTSYSELLDKLVHLAIERFEREQKLKSSR